jgi:hypothetical protein
MLIQGSVFHDRAGNIETTDCPAARKKHSEIDEEPLKLKSFRSVI